MAYTLEQIKDAGSPNFEQMFYVYQNSLDPREQKTRDQIVGLVSRPNYGVYCLSDVGVIGFIILYHSQRFEFSLLEYMAVDAAHRNAGLGALMFNMALNFCVDRSMVVEVDSDREDSADRTMRLRRKRFYGRLGCLHVANLDYKLPLPGEPPVMDLLIRPEPTHVPIARETLQQWLTDIYVSVYAQAPDDRRIAYMIAIANDPIRLTSIC